MRSKLIYAVIIIACLLFVAPAARADVPEELYIEAAPGISIFIDGEYQGLTTNGTTKEDKGLRLILLEGQYTLWAELAGKVIFQHTFYLEPGQTTTILISP
ncbi:MAG: hypothetical protein KAR83_05865 [Thermodesulfovibrionales bacterium]|nr:hypothetical protein [Thermodesulfovibrionales bacterium]